MNCSTCLEEIVEGRCLCKDRSSGQPEAPTPLAAPYFASYWAAIGDGTFKSYEIQTVRLYCAGKDGNGETFFQRVTELDECAEGHTFGNGDVYKATGPVLYGVYGRNPDGTAEHLFDRVTKEAAEDTLRKMGVSL